MGNFVMSRETIQEAGFRPEGDSIVLPEGSTVEVNTVIGLTAGEFPARLLCGVLPAFFIAEKLKESCTNTIRPLVRIFSTPHLSWATNGIQLNESVSQLREASRVLDRFAQTFFPEIGLRFVIDQPFSDETHTQLERLGTIIEDHAEAGVIDQIRARGRRWGGIQGEANAVKYAGHHIHGWREVSSELFYPDTLADIVINALPPADRIYTHLRRSVRSRLLQQQEIKRIPVDMEMDLCGTPHYARIDSDEPTLTEFLLIPLPVLILRMRTLAKEKKNDNFRKGARDLERLLQFMHTRVKFDDHLPVGELFADPVSR